MAEAQRMEWNYEVSRLGFDEILCHTMKTVRRYLDMATDYNVKLYWREVFGLLAKHAHTVDVGIFLLMIIQNSSTHMFLLMSQRMNCSAVPLNISMVPILLDAESAMGCMAFVEFLAHQSLNAEAKPVPTFSLPAPSIPT